MALLRRLAGIGLTILVILPIAIASDQIIRVEDPVLHAIFDSRFTEPMEIVYCLMNNGDLYWFTNYDENYVVVNGWILYDYFKKQGRDLKNVIIIIHNHYFQKYFSRSDKKVRMQLKDYGFKGRFLLYVVAFKEIYELKD
jgi:hypothetical protein